MSRIGKQPIEFKKEVKINIAGSKLAISGPKGELTTQIPRGIGAEVKDNKLIFTRKADKQEIRSLHGLIRNLAKNMVKGVVEGYVKELDIVGVGYKAVVQGRTLGLTLGFSHEVKFPIPNGIEIKCPNPNRIAVNGIDIALVGDVAAKIRKIKKVEPYQGTGIKYANEVVKRKAGKTGVK